MPDRKSQNHNVISFIISDKFTSQSCIISSRKNRGYWAFIADLLMEKSLSKLILKNRFPVNVWHDIVTKICRVEKSPWLETEFLLQICKKILVHTFELFTSICPILEFLTPNVLVLKEWCCHRLLKEAEKRIFKSKTLKDTTFDKSILSFILYSPVPSPFIIINNLCFDF